MAAKKIRKKKKTSNHKKKIAEFQDKLRELKTPLATSMGAINVVLLGGRGPMDPEQKRFLGVAKKNLDQLFFELQKFIDWLDRIKRQKS